jgi:hypothetical protein
MLMLMMLCSSFSDSNTRGVTDILHNKEAIGRIAKWACEVGAHDIEFRPRTTIKTQALVDFISEWTKHQVPDNLETTKVWRMYFDGSL